MTKIRVYADLSLQDINEQAQGFSIDLVRAYELIYKYGIMKTFKDRGDMEEFAEKYFYKIEKECITLLTRLVTLMIQEYKSWRKSHLTREEALYVHLHDWYRFVEDYIGTYGEGNFIEMFEDRTGEELENPLGHYSKKLSNGDVIELSNEMYNKWEESAPFNYTSIQVDNSIKMMEKLLSGDTADKIAAFNIGISTEHNYGGMLENFDVDSELLYILSETNNYAEKWNEDLQQMGVKVLGKRIYANQEDLQLVFGDELFEMDILNNDPWALAQLSDINILSNKELLASFVDMNFAGEGGVVVAAIFDAYDGESYDFDTVVHPKYQGRGLGTQLIEIAMDRFKSEILEMNPDAKLHLDVVNPGMVNFLKTKYGLEVKEEVGSHIIMGAILE